MANQSSQRMAGIAEALPAVLVFISPVVAMRLPTPDWLDFGVLQYLPSFESALSAGILSKNQLTVYEIEFWGILIFCVAVNYKYSFQISKRVQERRSASKSKLTKAISARTVAIILGCMSIAVGAFITYDRRIDQSGTKFINLTFMSLIFLAFCVGYIVSLTKK